MTVILDQEDEDDQGVTRSRHSVIILQRHTGVFPPSEWLTALTTNPVLGYWHTVSESWTRTEGGEVKSGGYTFDPDVDSYLWEEVLEFTDDSLRFWENDFASSSSSYSAGAYEIDGDELHL